MYSAELECRLMNIDKPPKYVTNLLAEVEDGLVLHNTSEARTYINKLATMLRDQQKQFNLYKNLNTVTTNQLSQVEEMTSTNKKNLRI